MIKVDPKLMALYQELYRASRQLYRYLGVDRDKAAKALERLNAASFEITLYLEREPENDLS